MGYLLQKLQHKDVWERILRERLTEPLHLNCLSLLVWALGSYRAKIAFDLVVRQWNAYGILKAADHAKALGIRRVSVVEFGVAAGAGLMNMAEIARRVTRMTGVQFSLYGFDTGQGMPAPTDYRDHPDLYQQGECGMDVVALRKALPANAQLVLGDLSDTVGPFIRSLSPREPIGYVSVDVDYYSSTVSALRLLTAHPEKYCPSRSCSSTTSTTSDIRVPAASCSRSRSSIGRTSCARSRRTASSRIPGCSAGPTGSSTCTACTCSITHIARRAAAKRCPRCGSRTPT